MDENHRDKTENKLWLPPLSPKDQEKLDHLRNNQRIAIIKRAGFSDKTLWNWLQLLIIPLILAVGGFWFSAQQNQISLQVSQRQHDNDQKIAADNRQKDIQIANDQQQEAALQGYLDHMSDLLLNAHLRESKPGDEIRQVARARKLTVLRRLDPKRKGTLLQFLYEAYLIGYRVPSNTPPSEAIIDLNDADLSGAVLSFADLIGANLNLVNLNNANLSGAVLSNAVLSGADLSGAVLNNADLNFADLDGANLNHANLACALQSHILGEMLP